MSAQASTCEVLEEGGAVGALVVETPTFRVQHADVVENEKQEGENAKPIQIETSFRHERCLFGNGFRLSSRHREGEWVVTRRSGAGTNGGYG